MTASDPARLRVHHLSIEGRGVHLVEGPAGWGEWSPLDGYPCAPEAGRRAAVEAATIDAPTPVRRSVGVNALVDDGDALPGAAPDGITAVKLKVGRRDPTRDVERVAALRRAVGPSVSIRVDANGAWDLETACDVLGRMAREDLEYAEQPVAALDDLARLRRRVAVPIAADEAVRSLEDARRLRVLGAADLLVLKVQPLGGVRSALQVAEVAGCAPVVSSMRETSIGRAAGLALAAALPALERACGLGTGLPGGSDVVAEPLAPRRGRLEVPAVPVVPDPGLLERYRVAA